MTDFATLNMTAQVDVAHWGWTIALFLWFIGLSGMGMFLNNWVREKALVYVCTAASILGTLLVVSHLARLTNLPFAAFKSLTEFSFNFGSWMFIGMCLLSLQCIVSCLYALAISGVMGDEKREWVVKSDLFNHFVGALGVFATIYSGFLLTQAVGITFWNTALIPLLWVMSGLACSIGCIELLMVSGRLPKEKVFWSRRTALWVEVAELFTIFAFVHVGLSSVSPAARLGAETLVTGDLSTMFWAGVIVFGSIIPLGINLVTRNHSALAVSALLGICGALLLRASVLFAGYYDPYIF